MWRWIGVLRFVVLSYSLLAAAAVHAAEITRIWLTHRTHEPTSIVVNWETPEPGNSIVHAAGGDQPLVKYAVEEQVTLHAVSIPLIGNAKTFRYRVQTGADMSTEATFKAYAGDELRAAVVADWQGRPNLDGLLQDNVHLLLTAGDNIANLHARCGAGVSDCTKPYGELIDAYPALFRSTPLMPTLGNHDREIRPRGGKPPAEPVYDVNATAFRRFFPLPDEGWKWRFDLPQVGVRFVALDLNHISDQGTTWQTCHPLDKDSEQFRWYEQLMTGARPPWVITLYNERNGTMRSQQGGAWERLFRRGTLAVSGFGYFAERAEANGCTYYNTALGTGAKYPDPQSKFFASVPSYLLLTIKPQRLVAQLKSLDGRVLDEREFLPPATR